ASSHRGGRGTRNGPRLRKCVRFSRRRAARPARSSTSLFSCEPLFEQTHRGNRGKHLVVSCETERIERTDRQHVDIREIARRKRELLVERLDEHEHVLPQLELLELLDEQLRLGCLDLEAIDDEQTLLTRKLREHRAHRAAVHLAIDLLREIARLRSKSATAAHPNRTADRAYARLAGALLTPRFRAAAAHFGFRLLRLRARTTGRAIRSHDLVYERFVEFTRKRRIGHLDVLRLRTLADQL